MLTKAIVPYTDVLAVEYIMSTSAIHFDNSLGF